MARCIYCYNILTAKDDYCYHCGDRVPKFADKAKRWPVSAWTNVALVALLAYTGYCFFAAHSLSLPSTIAVVSALVLLRILTGRLVKRNAN